MPDPSDHAGDDTQRGAGSPASGAQPAPEQPSRPTFTTAPTMPAGDPSLPWHRRHHRAVFISSIVAAFLVGVGTGGAGPQADLERAQAEATAARGQVEEARADAERRVGEAEERVAGADRRAREEANRTLASARAKVRSDAAALSRRKAELDRREAKVSGLERTADRNSFEGEGTYVVGADIKPGTYRADASPGCYWARLASLDTSNIINNDNADGPVVIEILPSDKAVTVSRCAEFRWVPGS